MSFWRYHLLAVLTLLLVGCGSGSDMLTAQGTSTSPTRARSGAEPVRGALNAGWNALAFPCPRLTTLEVPAEVLGMAAFQNGAYSVGPFTLEAVNAGRGARRGFWVFARSACDFTYAGEPGENRLELDNGWNLVSFATSPPVSMDGLQAQQNGQSVSLSAAVLTPFYAAVPGKYEAVGSGASVPPAGRAGSLPPPPPC